MLQHVLCVIIQTIIYIYKLIAIRYWRSIGRDTLWKSLGLFLRLTSYSYKRYLFIIFESFVCLMCGLSHTFAEDPERKEDYKEACRAYQAALVQAEAEATDQELQQLLAEEQQQQQEAIALQEQFQQLMETLQQAQQQQALLMQQEEIMEGLEEELEELEEFLGIAPFLSPLSGSPPGSPPASPGASPGSLSPPGGGSISLLGYTSIGNMHSLQGLQCLLVGPITQVSNILRTFALKANTGSLGKSFLKDNFSKSVVSGNSHAFRGGRSSRFNTYLTPQRAIATWTSSPFMAVTRQQRMGCLEEPLEGLFTRSCQVFSSVESYQQDLERKVNAAQVGFVASPVSLFKAGLAFTYNKEESQVLYGAKIGAATGGAQATSETKNLSALAAWNTDQAGVTGCLTSCYSWGHMKNTRYFSYAQGEAQAKGNPDIKLSGGLAQLGYNLEFSKNFLVTPYVECMFVSAIWSPYEEITGPLPSKISQSKEQVLEKSIGLRNCWFITESSQLQTWIAGVSGQHTTAGLHARPIIVPLSLYKISTPGHRRMYLQGEAGLSYDFHFTTDLDIGLHGSVRMEHMKHLIGQHIKCVFCYTY